MIAERIAAGVVSAALVSCVLVLDSPTEFAEHCAFEGRETDCGRCLVQRCQKQIDACCEGAWCGGLIEAVEGCASKSDQRCAEVRAAEAGAEGVRKDLALCAGDSCRGVCERAPPTSSSRCGETKFGAGSACVCTPATPQLPANGYQCDGVVFPDARCCASPSWPSTGNQCACLAVSCTPSRDGCACSLSDSYNPNATSECRGTNCCQTESVCRCGAEPCGPREKRVDACNVQTTPCTERSVPIAKCTLP